jgi:hypothetical protein
MAKTYGSCFRQAFEALRLCDRATLVHAYITNPSGRKIAHGWIEYKNHYGMDMVYDASVDQPFPKKFFYDGYKPEHIACYTPQMAVILLEESGMFGPWDYTLCKILRDDNIPIKNDNPYTRAWINNLLKDKR